MSETEQLVRLVLVLIAFAVLGYALHRAAKERHVE